VLHVQAIIYQYLQRKKLKNKTKMSYVYTNKANESKYFENFLMWKMPILTFDEHFKNLMLFVFELQQRNEIDLVKNLVIKNTKFT